MPNFTIVYDEPQEAEWFRSLNSAFANARESTIADASRSSGIRQVLAYDRPDIVLLDDEIPILVVEETVEVPSGHNVGQRFARIAAAAEVGVPFLYFGPYVAMKHGGATAGPRYMNVRLFHALGAVERIKGSAVTTINWPVDENFEVRRDPAKDTDVKEYIATFLKIYSSHQKNNHLNKGILHSAFHNRMVAERELFVNTVVRNPEQYDAPPPSVDILTPLEFSERHSQQSGILSEFYKLVIYKIGARSIRSDPYTGTAILYKYLYVSEYPSRALVLWFPYITEAMWRKVATNANRKDVRLFRMAADAMLFADGLVPSIDF